MNPLQNTSRLMLPLSLVFLALFSPAALGREILVTNGGDSVPPSPPLPGSLRAAVLAAVPGDVIKFQGTLVISLENDLSLGEGVTIEGPALITARPEPGPTRRPFEVMRVITQNVTLKNLTFRNIGIDVGRADLDGVGGFTMSQCKLTQAGYLDLTNADGAVVDRNLFQVSDDRSNESGAALMLEFTKGCAVTNNTFESGPKAGGISSSIDEDLLLENNTLNAAMNVSPRSARIIKNKLPKRRIFVDTLTVPDPGAVEIEDNECGVLHAQGLNMTVRGNTVSGKLVVKKEGRVIGAFEDEETLAFTAISIHAQRAGNDASTSGPVMIERNKTAGGQIGLLLSAYNGTTQMTVHDNTVDNATHKGILINQTAPITVTDNVLTRCGVKPFRGVTPAGLHLRDINTADVLVEGNTITHPDRLAFGIMVGRGSPTVRNNTIREGRGGGLYIFKDATPVIEGNSIERMARGGVVIESGADVALSSITLRENGVAGIVLNTGAKLLCVDAMIESNRGPGILFHAESKGTVTGSIMRKNRGAGAYILKDAEADLRGSVFGENKGAGIDIAPKGITPNSRPKQGNGGVGFPDELEYDSGGKTIRGEAEPGAVVQLFRSENGARTGNMRNGEGAVYLGETIVTGNGMFSISPGPAQEGDLFCLTATRLGAQPVTSEFSENIEVPPGPDIQRVSVSSSGSEGNAFSGENTVSRTMSDNGRFVVFSSLASNLVDNDANEGRDIFVRDVMNGVTERVSVNSAGEEATSTFAPPSSFSPVISGDGRWVVFASSGRNLLPGDTSTNFDICLRDRELGVTLGVTDPAFDDTERPVGQRTRSNGTDPDISADGSVVAFVSHDGGFIVGDTNGADDIYVWTRATGTYERVSVTSAGGQIPSGTNFATGNPRLSANGRCVVFDSFATLVPGNTTNGRKVYIRDRVSQTTELISTDASGAAVSGGAPSISADGRYVAFSTLASLVEKDTNGRNDIYVRDQEAGVLHFCSPSPDGSLFLDHAFQPALSADARFVAFTAPGSSTRGGFTVLHADIYIFDRETGVTREASMGVSGDANNASNSASFSPDGRFLTFQSHGADLVADDNNGVGDVFLRDRTRELNSP